MTWNHCVTMSGAMTMFGKSSNMPSFGLHIRKRFCRPVLSAMFACRRFRHPGLVSGWVPGPAVPTASQTQSNRTGLGHDLLFRRRLPPWQRACGGDRGRRGQAECPQLRLFHLHRGPGWTWSSRTVWKKPTKHHLRCQAVHREEIWAGDAGAGECAISLQGGSPCNLSTSSNLISNGSFTSVHVNFPICCCCSASGDQ